MKARAQKQKPVTPFNLFFDYKKLFGDVKRTELVNEYHNLSLDEKYKWIEKAITTNPDVEHKQFLTKDEVRIMTGNFKKSPSAYGLFLRDNFDKNASNAMRDVARKWKTLDPTHKSEYIRRSEDVRIIAQMPTNNRFLFSIIILAETIACIEGSIVCYTARYSRSENEETQK